MTRHDDETSLLHMYEHAVEVCEYMQDYTFEEFLGNRIAHLVATRLLSIIGEAATRVSADLRAAHLEIPWRQIISFRNILTHGYDVIDYEIVWYTVADELPQLISQLEHIRNDRSEP
jgi:uncharacterized protein with HEPN domain